MKRKRILQLVLTAVFAAVMVCSFAACGEQPAGKFYGLGEAYDQALITKEDLQKIADYYNSGTRPEEPLDKKAEKAIKQTLAYDENKEFRERGDDSDYKPDDYSVVSYFGKYGECYVIVVDSNHWYHLVSVSASGRWFSDPNDESNFWFEIRGVKFQKSALFREFGVIAWKAL